MNLTQEQALYLLHIIKHDGNISQMCNLGHSYSELMNKLVQYQQQDIIQFKETKVVLTRKGENYVKELNIKKNKRGLYKYFAPAIDRRIPKMKIEEIFIPLKEIKEGLFSQMHENAKDDESSPS